MRGIRKRSCRARVVRKNMPGSMIAGRVVVAWGSRVLLVESVRAKRTEVALAVGVCEVVLRGVSEPCAVMVMKCAHNPLLAFSKFLGIVVSLEALIDEAR